jgi:hypothetical protein
MAIYRRRLCISLGALLALGALAPLKVGASDLRTLTGEVLIQSVENKRIVVAVDTMNEGKAADGIADSVFYFVPEMPLAEPISVHLPKANLEVGSRRLKVVVPAAKGAILTLAIDPPIDRKDDGGGIDIRAATGESTAEGHRAQVRRPGLVLAGGRELTEYHGELELSMKDLATGGPEFAVGSIDYQDWMSEGGGGSCTAGGVGSTGCSVSCGGLGCSTSCRNGTYACCNCSGVNPSCSCKLP